MPNEYDPFDVTCAHLSKIIEGYYAAKESGDSDRVFSYISLLKNTIAIRNEVLNGSQPAQKRVTDNTLAIRLLDNGNAALCDAAGEPLVNQISFTLDNPAFGQARATVTFHVDGEQIRFK